MKRSKILRTVAATGMIVALTAAAAPDYDGIYPNDRYHPTCGQGETPAAAGTICLTDNSTLTYYPDSGGWGELEDLDKWELAVMLGNQYNPTDLETSYDYDPVFSGEAETDIIYQEDSEDLDGAIGAAWCNDKVNGNNWRCDQHYVRIKGGGYYQTHGFTCHETGHVVGLLHGFNTDPEIHHQDDRLGCMKTFMTPPGTLGANNKHFINEVY